MTAKWDDATVRKRARARKSRIRGDTTLEFVRYRIPQIHVVSTQSAQ